MAICEMAVVCDMGLPFIKTCCQAEGDFPLILTAYLIFNSLEKVFTDQFSFPNIIESSNEVLALLNAAEQVLLSKITTKSNIHHATKIDFESSLTSYNSLLNLKHNIIFTGRSRFGHIRASSERNVDMDALENINIQLAEATQIIRMKKRNGNRRKEYRKIKK